MVDRMQNYTLFGRSNRRRGKVNPEPAAQALLTVVLNESDLRSAVLQFLVHGVNVIEKVPENFGPKIQGGGNPASTPNSSKLPR